MNLALDGLPEFTCLARRGRAPARRDQLQPSIDYMELAYDDAKAGRFSRRPFIDMVIPTLVDPSMAPPGKHVMSCFVQYAPTTWPTAPNGTTPGARHSARRSSTPSRSERRHPPTDPARAGAFPQGHRGPVRSCRRATSSRASSPRAALLQRPVAGWARIARRYETWMCGSAPPRRRSWGVWPSRRPPGRALAPTHRAA